MLGVLGGMGPLATVDFMQKIIALSHAGNDIKGNRLETDCHQMEKVFDNLISAGADTVILGCTEIPVGLARIARQKPELCIDATELLARASIDWYYDQQALAA